VGPFEQHGAICVEAALAAGCHYLDTTGEQFFMLDVREQFGESYKEKGLCLAPSTAYMYAPMEICANLVLETCGIDSLDGVSASNMFPTYASTQSIFGLFMRDAYYLSEDKLMQYGPAPSAECVVPGFATTMLSSPWSGGSLPVWFHGDDRVVNCRQHTCFTNRPLFEGILGMQRHFEENIRPLPEDQHLSKLQELAAGLQPGTPARENMMVHRTVDCVRGSGTGVSAMAVIRSGPVYQQTGMFQAAVAAKLLKSGPDKAGFASPCQVAGYDYLLSQLKTFFPTEVEIRDGI
jgi:hypothetical protein